ncbi:MAG TPA: NAD(P)/FAD-dependent oxidoreductase [Phototrophicaceae bacterium]|jgi:NAD(P)H-nitrite reductase large subunit|nr:NAD(P)/FAD-dependent oxidoreductase [Phototrophicaceae bacterium]
MMRYIIIGSGIAGVTAAKTLRQHDPEAQITVFAEEYHPLGLYARKDLARQLAIGLGESEALLIERDNDLKSQGITFVHQPIPRIYPDLNQIFVNHAFRANYDKLLITTGATPMLVDVSGHHLLGVHQLRTYDDATLIEDWISELRELGAIIIGGGILGLDMTYALLQRGVPVTLVVRESRLGVPLLSVDEAQVVEDYLRGEGVTLMLECEVSAFLSEDGKLLDSVELNNGQVIHTGMALCCIGVRPTTAFLEDSGINVDSITGGVVVNAHFQSNIDNIYAAGGCALVDGNLSRNWATAAEQGRIAALNMLGHETVFAPLASENIEPPLVLTQLQKS